MLDTIDSLCNADAHAAEMTYYSEFKTGEVVLELSLERTAGIPTGTAPDIQAHIKRRQNRKPPPSDNLAG